MTYVPSTQRVLTRDQMLAMGHMLLDLVQDQSLGIQIEHTARAVTKVINGRVLHTEDGDQLALSFQSAIGSGLPVAIATDRVRPETIRQIVAQVKSLVPPKRPADEIEADDPDSPDHFTYNAREHQPVSIWHDTTIRAMDTARGDVLPHLVEQVRASGLNGAATVGFAARSVLYLYKYGLTAFATETDSEVTLTARAPDGTSSGWAGQAHRDWTQLRPDIVARDAIDMANRSKNMVALEPGRRMAILGPAAVGQLVAAMARCFDAAATRKRATPFAYAKPTTDGRVTKIGMRVFDPRILMRSDPTDPLGGYPPFFEEDGIEPVVLGFPTVPMTWIDHGILTGLAYDVGLGVASRNAPADVPRSVRLTTVPGTQTATIAEMIANCKEGVYVNRFSDVELLDGQSGQMTGVTRDGCFLVKDGKIAKPVKNFRFVDSPAFAFNRIEMIGTPERVAFGYSTGPNSWEGRRWPRLPIIVPPMMIQDFNFTALSDSV